MCVEQASQMVSVVMASLEAGDCSCMMARQWIAAGRAYVRTCVRTGCLLSVARKEEKKKKRENGCGLLVRLLHGYRDNNGSLGKRNKGSGAVGISLPSHRGFFLLFRFGSKPRYSCSLSASRRPCPGHTIRGRIHPTRASFFFFY